MPSRRRWDRQMTKSTNARPYLCLPVVAFRLSFDYRQTFTQPHHDQQSRKTQPQSRFFDWVPVYYGIVPFFDKRKSLSWRTCSIDTAELWDTYSTIIEWGSTFILFYWLAKQQILYRSNVIWNPISNEPYLCCHFRTGRFLITFAWESLRKMCAEQLNLNRLDYPGRRWLP